MLRGEQVLCGTTTTGTGTLTLATTPGPPGGVDFDVLARATGIGLANNKTALVSYTIIEYAASSFSTAKKLEKGIGTLTLGSSSGIANCTLARTAVQVTAINLDSPPATYSPNAPSAMSIGTAANTLVFIGPSATDLFACSPYFDTGVMAGINNAATDTGTILVTLNDYYSMFDWTCPMLVKKATARVITTTTGTTNAYGRIYAVGTDGRPGALLLDLGVMGTANASLNTAADIASAVHANGYYLLPGTYYWGFIASFSTGSPQMRALDQVAASSPGFARLASTGGCKFGWQATGGTATPAPDPANVTGLASASSVKLVLATLAPS
jgi:hypothetical protein